MQKPKNHVLTIPELCSFLRIGKNTAYDLVHSGEIKSFQIRGRIRIPMQSVIEFIEKEQEKSEYG